MLKNKKETGLIVVKSTKFEYIGGKDRWRKLNF